MDIRHHTCTYQGCTNIISVNAPCTIFHVVYSANISNLFLLCIFPIRARATLMEEPSHHHCNDTIEKQQKKNRQENQKKEEAITLQINILHVVMSRSCRLEAWKELHMYPLKTNPLLLVLFFFPKKKLRRTLLMTKRPYVEAPRISDLESSGHQFFLFELR